MNKSMPLQSIPGWKIEHGMYGGDKKPRGVAKTSRKFDTNVRSGYNVTGGVVHPHSLLDLGRLDVVNFSFQVNIHGFPRHVLQRGAVLITYVANYGRRRR